MAKVKTRKFVHKNPAGERLEFSSDISVDSNGLFNATVPDEVAEAVRTQPGSDVWVTKPREKNRVTGRELHTVEKAVRSGMKEVMDVETTVERVIVYSHKIDLNAWENSDGSLHANGGIGKDESDEGGCWHPMGGHLHAQNKSDYFRVGLYAEVLDMVTHRRANSERVEFKNPEWEHDHFSFDTWGSKLNGFASLGRPGRVEDLPRLPYTEDNARFFYEIMIALCFLGRNLHEFFSDQENVTRAIERGAVPVLADLR